MTVFGIGELVCFGEYKQGAIIYDVVISNSIDSPLVGISKTLLNGMRVNTQFVDWRLLSRVPVTHITLDGV